jgi:hypothetical protein
MGVVEKQAVIRGQAAAVIEVTVAGLGEMLGLSGGVQVS